MAEARFETLSPHVDWFTPDDRTDRPSLGAVHGTAGTLLVEGGASVSHLSAFVAELEARGRPPVTGIALTHWHWDHSFGSAAVAAPVIAHRQTAEALALQAGYDWSDVALDARVADGREIAFCADMIKVELPDRSDLQIVLPSVIVEDSHSIDLGGVTAVMQHVGGDHAADSCVIYVPKDRVLFTGDALYERLYAPVHHLTVAGVRAVTKRLAGFDVAIAVEGHDDEVADEAAFAARLAELNQAADLVESDPGLAELIAFLRAGE